MQDPDYRILGMADSVRMLMRGGIFYCRDDFYIEFLVERGRMQIFWMGSSNTMKLQNGAIKS